MCAEMCVGMHQDMGLDAWRNSAGMCLRMCSRMCLDMCSDMCLDLCSNMHLDVAQFGGLCDDKLRSEFDSIDTDHGGTLDEQATY